MKKHFIAVKTAHLTLYFKHMSVFVKFYGKGKTFKTFTGKFFIWIECQWTCSIYTSFCKINFVKTLN